MSLTAIVLCGGRSTRMGRDKGALPFARETMLSHITATLRRIADDVIIVGRRDQAAATVHDATDDLGPLSGIATGLAASKTDLNLVVACDMPLIRADVLRRLIAAIDDSDACVAMVEGHASALCGVYRSRIAGEAQSLLDSGERRVMRLLDRVKTKRVDAALFRDIDPNLETFTSVDTPEQYRKAVTRFPSP